MGDRIEKYKTKLSGEIRKQRYDSQKKQMVELETAASADMEKIEVEIKSMVQDQPALYLPYYIIFAKEIYSKKKKFTGQTLINELKILDEKWNRRGLDWITLENIKNFYVPAYPEGLFFIMDLSLLDGPHILA